MAAIRGFEVYWSPRHPHARSRSQKTEEWEVRISAAIQPRDADMLYAAIPKIGMCVIVFDKNGNG